MPDNNQEPHIRTAVVDFDGTLASYDRWRGADHYGEPILDARNALQELREWGWRIIVFTTRGDTEGIHKWLTYYNFPSEIKVNSIEHNPPATSAKPIADVYFDDRDAHIVGHSPYNWRQAMKRVRRLYQPPLNTHVDDAAAWSSWLSILIRWILQSRR